MPRVSLTLGALRLLSRPLVDTGNSLTDRANRRVIVADWRVVLNLLPPDAGGGAGGISSPPRRRLRG